MNKLFSESASVISSKDLRNTAFSGTNSLDFDKWDLDKLTDYIINTHHRYAKENAVIICNLAHEVLNHHSQNHPELPKLASSIFLFLHDLLNHMMKEEQILFANIRQLIKKRRIPGTAIYTTFGFIRDSVRLMQKEHKIAGEDLRYFRKLTNDYTLSAESCKSYRYLFEKMKEFEDDLLLHVHLENDILFPKAIAADEETDENIKFKNN